MSKIKVLIVEDEIIISMELQMLLNSMGYSVLKPVSSYESAIKSIKNGKPDICILDIQLEGEKSGLDIAKYLNDNKKIPFIFLTNLSSPEIIDKAKLNSPNAYLVKPYQKENIYSSIEVALHNFHSSNTNSTLKNAINTKDHFLLKDKGSYIKVAYDSIAYAKSEHVYVELFTTRNNTYLIRSTIPMLLSSLPSNFIRIHRSFIINVDFINEYKYPNVKIKNKVFPVSRTYKKDFEKAIDSLWDVKK